MSKKSVTLTDIHLDSGKVVTIIEPKIKTFQTAELAARAKSGSGPISNSIMQSELIKLLIYEIDGATVSGAAKENLDDLLNFAEYGQLSAWIGENVGAGLTDPKQMKTKVRTVNI